MKAEAVLRAVVLAVLLAVLSAKVGKQRLAEPVADLAATDMRRRHDLAAGDLCDHMS